jgi:Lysophospholipase
MKRNLRRLSGALLIFLSSLWAPPSARSEAPRLGAFEKPRPRTLFVPQAGEHFSEYEALNGSTSSPEQCSRIPDAVWVETDGGGDCIRYYQHGLSESNPVVLVYFSGDVILRNSKGVRFVAPSYLEQTPAGISRDMASWHEQAGKPVIYLARPGIHGSSGDHNKRRYPYEVALMDGALARIKERYKVGSFILAGHSGGGHIAASLLNRRSDIDAVAISSGMLAVKRVMDYFERLQTIPGWMLYDVKAFYDPVEEVDRIRKQPQPQIYIISDPEDRAVPFSSQLYYVRKLRDAGFVPHHVYAYAPDKKHHLLALNARLAAALAARDKGAKDIRRALFEMDLDNAE